MKHYVLGFAFDQYGAVALINKKRPDWQAGKWNGIGGHQENGETQVQAQSREFHEETGMLIHPIRWRLAGEIKKDGDYRCPVFTTVVPVLHVHTCTDEVVRVFPQNDSYILGGTEYPCLANIPSLISLCQMAPDRDGIVPFFTLDYKA